MQIRPRTAALLGLSTLANPGSSTPAVDVEAVLSTLPLPPDIDPPTFASAAPLEEVFGPAAHARSSCLESRSPTGICSRASACGGIPFLASPGYGC